MFDFNYISFFVMSFFIVFYIITNMKFNVKLIELPNKILRKKSIPVSTPFNQENINLAKKMLWHIKESIKKESKLKFRPAVGVAAVQYGILKQIFCIHIEEDNEIIFSDVLANPKIIAKSESKIAIRVGEGCLSVNEKHPNQDGLIRRSYRIKVEAFSYKNNKQMIFDVKGYLAIVFQHEIDHLLGKLFIDYIDFENKWVAAKDLELI